MISSHINNLTPPFNPPTTHLGEMLAFRRPHGSITERAFVKHYIATLRTPRGPFTPYCDAFGNYVIRIGPGGLVDTPGPVNGRHAPVLWSCHTDTVHGRGGRQRIMRFGLSYMLAPTEIKSDCLGADCTTGVWLMLAMIERGVEGLYIFHRAEECGGLGSSHIAKHTPELLEGIDMAIALDRMGQSSIITHQVSGRCASDEFAASLALQLPGYEADPTGLFTDTANYTHLIPECTNLSIGYEHAHSPWETQDIYFTCKLLEWLTRLDTRALVIERNHLIDALDDYDWNYGDNYCDQFGGKLDEVDYLYNKYIVDKYSRHYKPLEK